MGKPDPDHPLVVVMGISGVGKSAVGHEVADRLGLDYADGDDFHSAANIAKMSAGEALGDADRWPWLDAIARWLAEHEGTGGVISCSALKRSYRDVLRDGSERTLFLHLVGNPDLILDRMSGRDHFMPESLLESQEQTLEELHPDELGWVFDISPSPEEIVDDFVARAGLESA